MKKLSTLIVKHIASAMSYLWDLGDVEVVLSYENYVICVYPEGTVAVLVNGAVVERYPTFDAFTDAYGARVGAAFAEQVKDAQRAVSQWPQSKRDAVVLEGRGISSHRAKGKK